MTFLRLISTFRFIRKRELTNCDFFLAISFILLESSETYEDSTSNAFGAKLKFCRKISQKVENENFVKTQQLKKNRKLFL